MTKDDVLAGRIAGVFGVRGELKCDPTSAGRILFVPGAELRCEHGDESSTICLSGVRSHKERLLIRIDGVDDADAAQAYAGARLFAAREAISLAEGEYLDEDLTGCDVYGEDGARYGTVLRVEHYPSSDMLVVGEHLVPMVSAIVRSIDLAARRITIDPPAGLFD